MPKNNDKEICCSFCGKTQDQVKIMIGGAPVTQEFCNQIGADCYTADAASAADAAVVFCQEFYQK